MSNATELAQAKAELEELCEVYAEQIAKVQQAFSEIALKIIALPEKHGVDGMRLGIEIMPRVNRIHQNTLAMMKAASGQVLN